MSAVTRSGLLEREEFLETLAQMHAAARQGRGRLVLVAAEAGGGKTALIEAFRARLAGATRFLTGVCDALFTPRPLGPFADIGTETAGELAGLIEAGAKPHDVFRALVDEFGRAATVLVLEDVHWADEATLDVLRLLGRRIEATGTLMIATYRDDEIYATHPLQAVLGELTSARGVERMRLPALSAEAVRELAEPTGADAEGLFQRTGGNPFFVTEALAAADAAVPATVRDAVLARAAPLSAAARRLLEVVAVVPGHAELWLLEAVAARELDSLEECLFSGMLLARDSSVGFRHELARLAVEESLPPTRRIELHRRTLAALESPVAKLSAIELARAAHHAEAAGDSEAVLQYATAAGDYAGELGASREAAAQYARALRFSEHLGLEARADLLERRAYACYLIGELDEALEAQERALDCHRELEDRLGEGDSLRSLSRLLRYVGRGEEAMEVGREAVTVLEPLPSGRELGMAYCNLSHLYMHREDEEGTVEWGRRALDLAERLGDREIAVYALTNIGNIELLRGRGVEKLERSLELAQEAGIEEHAGRAFVALTWWTPRGRSYAAGDRYVERGLEYCTERGLDLWRHFLLAYRSRSELDRGRWDDAVASAAPVLRDPRTSQVPRVTALAVLGSVRARRGDPEVWPLLDEAWALAEPTGELQRVEPVAVARAEAFWLQGRHAEVDGATAAALELARGRRAWWIVGELACWRRRAGIAEGVPEAVPEPWAAELAGDWSRAAELWAELDAPYEAALARAASDGEEGLREAYEQLSRLGAQPAAAAVARRLRKRGVRGMPRGPRPATRSNPAGLTPRELEVLALLAEGSRNSDIAERLFLSVRTVDHHVGSILRKLEARTRGEAATAARRLGLIEVP